MTNYNDGLWHAWNGGECPLHPESIIEVVKMGPERDAVADHPSKAGLYIWEHGFTAFPIIAFRVVKEYREPREMWQLLDRYGEVFDTFTDLADAKHDHRQYPKFTLVHYREVVEGGDA